MFKKSSVIKQNTQYLYEKKLSMIAYELKEGHKYIKNNIYNSSKIPNNQ